MNEGPNPIDVHVGERIRRRRKIIGQSQETLAAALGLSFQQVQKYERGANRISASMMFRAAEAQGISPAYYFEGLDAQLAQTTVSPATRDALAWMQSPAAIDTARAIAQLPPHMQQAVLKVAISLADVHEPAPQLLAAE